MGLSATCEMTIDGRVATGTAQLEPGELRLLAGRRLTVPFSDITSAVARSGRLVVSHRKGELILTLGKAAEAWAQKIRYPRSRVEKLGVKPGCRVALRGFNDVDLVAELKAAGATVTARLGKGPYDIVLVRLEATSDLPRLRDARARMVPNGLIWAVWPKGRTTLREDDIRRCGTSADLVDVKVMSFSDTLSGLKLVIPVAHR